MFERTDSCEPHAAMNAPRAELPQQRVAEHSSLDTYRAIGAALSAWIVAIGGWVLFQIPNNSATFQLPGGWKGETAGDLTAQGMQSADPANPYGLNDVNFVALGSLLQHPGLDPMFDRLDLAALQPLMHALRDANSPAVDVNVVLMKAKMQMVLMNLGSWGGSGGGGGGGSGEVDPEAFKQALEELLKLPYLLFQFLDLAVLTEKLDALLLNVGNLFKGNLFEGNLVELKAEIDKIDVTALKEQSGWTETTVPKDKFDSGDVPQNVDRSPVSAVTPQHDDLSDPSATPGYTAPPQSMIKAQPEQDGGFTTPVATSPPSSEQPNPAATAKQEANTPDRLSDPIGKTVDALKGGNKFEPGSAVSLPSGQTDQAAEPEASATTPPDDEPTAGRAGESGEGSTSGSTSEGTDGSGRDD